jgi:hypothetical protein
MICLVKTKVSQLSPYFDEKLVKICPVLEISKRVENSAAQIIVRSLSIADEKRTLSCRRPKMK